MQHRVLVEIEAAPSTVCGQLWNSRDLQPPALVIHQVEVQFVELQEGHEIQELLNGLLGLEVARHIDGHAAITEERGVGNSGPGNGGRGALRTSRRRAIRIDRYQLAQGLDSVEHTRAVGTRNLDASVGDPQGVSLRIRLAVSVHIQARVDAEVDDVPPNGTATLDADDIAAEHVLDRHLQKLRLF